MWWGEASPAFPPICLRMGLRMISRERRAKRTAWWQQRILGKNKDWMILPLPESCFPLERNGVASNINAEISAWKLPFKLDESAVGCKIFCLMLVVDWMYNDQLCLSPNVQNRVPNMGSRYFKKYIWLMLRLNSRGNSGRKFIEYFIYFQLFICKSVAISFWRHYMVVLKHFHD